MMKLLLMLCATRALLAQQQPTIALTSQPVRPGTQATIPVTLSGAAASGIAALQFFMPSIPGMATTAGPAATAAGKSVTCAAVSGQFGCVIQGGATTLQDGVLATIALPSPSAATPLPLSGLLGVNAAGDSPGIPITSGQPFTLTPINACDVTGDGKVDVGDAANVVLQILGVSPPSTDLNGDGKTTLVDLQRVVDAAQPGGSCRTGA